MNCDDLRALSGLPLVESCDRLRDGQLRIQTPFLYPDGSNVDLFVQDNFDLFSRILISDGGQTFAYLLNLHVQPWTSVRQKSILDTICTRMGVTREGALLKVEVDSLRNLPAAVGGLGQACTHVACLALTKTFRGRSRLRSEVEEFFVEKEMQFDKNIVVRGKYTDEVKFDFSVPSNGARSLVLTVSAPDPRACDESLRKWYEVQEPEATSGKLTIYDSSTPISDDDLARIQSVGSSVKAFPSEKKAIMEFLAA